MMNVEISRLTPEEVVDFEMLLRIFGVVFEHSDLVIPERHYLRQLLSRPDFWAIVARVEGGVTGGATAYVLPSYYTTQSTLYIYDIVISPRYQQQGIGRKIMAFLREQCVSQGIPEMYVQAEAEDIETISFYQKTISSRETETVQFSYILK